LKTILEHDTPPLTITFERRGFTLIGRDSVPSIHRALSQSFKRLPRRSKNNPFTRQAYFRRDYLIGFYRPRPSLVKDPRLLLVPSVFIKFQNEEGDFMALTTNECGTYARVLFNHRFDVLRVEFRQIEILDLIVSSTLENPIGRGFQDVYCRGRCFARFVSLVGLRKDKAFLQRREDGRRPARRAPDLNWELPCYGSIRHPDR
jgi:hypothetical protein